MLAFLFLFSLFSLHSVRRQNLEYFSRKISKTSRNFDIAKILKKMVFLLRKLNYCHNSHEISIQLFTVLILSIIYFHFEQLHASNILLNTFLNEIQAR